MDPDAGRNLGTFPSNAPVESEPTEEELLAEVAGMIAEREALLSLDDPAVVDIAIEAAGGLALIYNHFGNMPARDRALARLNYLVSHNRTSTRTKIAEYIFGQLAVHPAQHPAA